MPFVGDRVPRGPPQLVHCPIAHEVAHADPTFDGALSPSAEYHPVPGKERNKAIALEVVLLGPNPSEPLSLYVARLCQVPGEQPIELEVDALPRILTPAARPLTELTRRDGRS